MVSMKLDFNVGNYNNPKTKEYSHWYHTKPNESPPAGLINKHIIRYHYKEIKYLKYIDEDQPFANNNKTCQRFLEGMSQTYHDLAVSTLNSTENINIFEINSSKKSMLNDMIHFTHQNWDARQHGMKNGASLTLKKNSHYGYISHPWKNLNQPNLLSTMSKTYETTLQPISKTNLIKPSKRTINYTRTPTFFPKTMTRTLVLVFLLAINNI